MKNSKYNYNKSSQAFFDSINQQPKFYANNMVPMSQHKMQMPSKRGGANMYVGNENMYYPSGIDVSTQNGCHYYDQAQQQQQHMNTNGMVLSNHGMGGGGGGGRQRYAPYSYQKRSYDHAIPPPAKQPRFYNYAQASQQQQTQPLVSSNLVNISEQNSPADSSFSSSNGHTPVSSYNGNISNPLSTSSSSNDGSPFDGNANKCVTLQISNLDTTIEENDLKQLLINRLKPIASVISIYFESMSIAKIKLPSDHQARQVIAYLHRKKIGHKRITVSYTRESSTLDSSTLRCQVAGLLKDIPNYKLSMYKFRELFQLRFKTSISVVDLHDMKDICTIIGNKNEELITLRTELIDSMESSELMEYFQHSVPYCTQHFVKINRGWAEQEIDPLPNVQMTIAQVRDIMFALLKNHKGAVPIASIVHCIQADLNIFLDRNENGVNFEHLISCVQGVQITSNKFSIKTLNWSNGNEQHQSPKDNSLLFDDGPSSNRYMKYGNMPDSFTQISREIIELIKLSPKATLKFSRFIPAYHNHFGKQCRVADYGYTKLIDLFEALPSVVQVMGEGENRQITLTHRIQMQRFKTDLLRILRTQTSKSLLLSHIPTIYEQVQGRKFNITDYGVCDINDILDSLVNTNVVVVNSIPYMMDTMISMPKRKQSSAEVEKTSNFAAEVVELFKHASQYTILFEKFACSYHYHFGYQCRLSDYGFLKLADLMESIAGVVKMELSNEEDRKIFLSPSIAQRVFSEQLKELIESYTGSSETVTNWREILVYHKKQYGYQIQPQSLGFHDIFSCIESLPYVEVVSSNGQTVNIKCHHDDQNFRNTCYAAVRLLLDGDHQERPLSDFIVQFNDKFNKTLNERTIKAMKHAIEIHHVNDIKYVAVSKQIRFVLELIEVIEMHGAVKLQDLSTSLKLSFKAFFPFGYPNLTTFIQAYPDIFVLQLSKTNPALNEVSVSRACILSKNGFVRNINYFMESSISYSANTSSQSNDENNNNNSKESNHNNNNNDSTTVNYNEKIASANLQSPTTPYWNNPIWSNNISSSPQNIKLDIPDLQVMNSTLTLDSPLVMARIATKNKFVYPTQKE